MQLQSKLTKNTTQLSIMFSTTQFSMPIKNQHPKYGNFFSFPNTRTIRYHWMRDGVNYVGIMVNPRSNSIFQQTLLSRHVATSEVIRIEAI